MSMKRPLPLSFVFMYLLLLIHSCFIMHQFLLYNKVNQLSIYIYTLFLKISFPFKSPQSIEQSPQCYKQVLISYLFYTQYQQPILYIVSTVYIDAMCIVSIFQLVLCLHFPPWYPYVCSLLLCLYFCLVNKIVDTNFFRFHKYVLIYMHRFSFSDFFILYHSFQVHPHLYK